MQQYIYNIGKKVNKNKPYKLKVKIGKSKNVRDRLKALQTGNSDKLEILKTFKTHMAKKVEKALHKKFSEYRGLGEWFIFDNKKTYSECVNSTNHVVDIINHIFCHKYSKKYLTKTANDFINEFIKADYKFIYTKEYVNNIINSAKREQNKEKVIKAIALIKSDPEKISDCKISDSKVCDSKVYDCKICNYRSSRIQDLNRHKKTKKHLTNIEKPQGDIIDVIVDKKFNKIFNEKIDKTLDKILNEKSENNNVLLSKSDNKLACKFCSKKFSHYQSKWKHEKDSCKEKNAKSINNVKPANDEIVKLEKRIDDLTKLVGQLASIINSLSDKMKFSNE